MYSSGGCNHMTCTSCHGAFCWLCHQAYEPDHFQNQEAYPDCYDKQFTEDDDEEEENDI